MERKLESILTHFQRQDGRGCIADVRRSADVKRGDPYAKKLDQDPMRHVARERYELTPEGQERATASLKGSSH